MGRFPLRLSTAGNSRLPPRGFSRDVSNFPLPLAIRKLIFISWVAESVLDATSGSESIGVAVLAYTWAK